MTDQNYPIQNIFFKNLIVFLKNSVICSYSNFAQLKMKKKPFTFFRPNHKTLSAWWEGKHTVSLHASDYAITKIITE